MNNTLIERNAQTNGEVINSNKGRKEKLKASIDKVKKKTEKRKVGDLGENVACTFLMKLGYTIIGRNYLRKYGEIDIICSKDGVYYFVEVKTVTQRTEYRPEENVHSLKLKRMARAVEAYIHEKKLGDREWKCLVLSVYLNMDTRLAKVTMLEDVVLQS